MKLSYALLVVLLGQTTAALAYPANMMPPPVGRGHTLKVTDDDADDEEDEDDGADVPALIGCADTKPECQRIARREGYARVNPTQESNTCPDKIYSCYGYK